jgi:hypothetical protein
MKKKLEPAAEEPTTLHAVRIGDNRIDVWKSGTIEDVLTLSAAVLVGMAAETYCSSPAKYCTPEQFAGKLCEMIREHLIGQITDRAEE